MRPHAALTGLPPPGHNGRMWRRPKACILLMSLLGGFISEARADIGWQPERTWVFAVGILRWKHPDVYDPFPDAIPNRADRRLVDALKTAGVPADHVVFLVDERATLAAIRRAYRGQLDRIRRGDLLIFYFAGHGARDRTTRATYFANYDADADGEVALREVAAYAEQSMAFLEHQKSMFTTTNDFDPGLAVADTHGTPAAGLGRRVEVEWKGTWYPAEVVGIRGGRSLVHYAEYDASWDEWVGPDRIRDPQVRKLPRGCRVKVLWPEDQAWYLGTVLASRFGMHKIHYDGYSQEWDDWVASEAIEEVDE